MAQLHLDLWETASSVIAAEHGDSRAQAFAQRFPELIAGAMLFLDSDASLLEWREAVRMSALVQGISDAVTLGSFNSTLVDTFERHGVDDSLVAYCSGLFEAYQCH
ncbi:MAG: hypothetical protein HY791_11610 [Deltaproteobacteria bacterium]|nr:hypothetical protein [Deltaproteobacteria bacterium]